LALSSKKISGETTLEENRESRVKVIGHQGLTVFPFSDFFINFLQERDSLRLLLLCLASVFAKKEREVIACLQLWLSSFAV